MAKIIRRGSGEQSNGATTAAPAPAAVQTAPKAPEPAAAPTPDSPLTATQVQSMIASAMDGLLARLAPALQPEAPRPATRPPTPSQPAAVPAPVLPRPESVPVAPANPDGPPIQSSYKGKPMLVLNPRSKYKPLQFGVVKARMILAELEAIRSFVAAHGDASEDE